MCILLPCLLAKGIHEQCCHLYLILVWFGKCKLQMSYTLNIKLSIIYNLQSRNPQIKSNLKALSRGIKMAFAAAPSPGFS